MKAAYVKLQEKSNAVFVAGQELEKRYNHLSEVNGYLEGEKVRLEEENLKFRGQLASDKRSMFGSKSERTDNIFTGDVVQEDPIAEDAPIEEERGDADGKESNHNKKISVSAEKATTEICGRTGQQSSKKRNGGNSKTDAFAKFSHLDQVYHFERDEEKNADPRLELLRYEDHWEVRETRPTNYVYHMLTPVYKEKEEDGSERLVSVPMQLNLWPGSYVSSSLFARIVTEKFVKGVTTYAMEAEYQRRGIPLRRQAISRWIIHFSENIFKEMCEYLGMEMDERFLVQQMDETWLTQVVWSQKDKEAGKKNGAKGLLWERISGELSDGPGIVLYTYSKTRSVEFLKKALKNMAGYLVSDAYGAYFAMEKIKGRQMAVASCWMHCRRYLATAVIVSDAVLHMWEDASEEEILEQPAVKALLIANKIFEEDTKLKRLQGEERYEKRLKKVAPLVDEFFEFIHSIDIKGKDMFEALRKAVVYAMNQEGHLRTFLKDGEIPIDNGHCERYIKYVAKVRKSCLFAYSECGAEAFGRIMSVIWTAIMNGADPFYYVKFILEEWAKLEQNGVKDRKQWFAKRMPWSPDYIEWERQQKAHHTDEFVPDSEKPREGEKVRCKGELPADWKTPSLQEQVA